MRSGHICRRGPSWAVYYEKPRDPVTGKRRKASKTGFRTKQEAQAWLNRTLVSLEEGTFVEPTKVTLGEFVRDEWLPSLATRGLRPNTLTGYEQHMAKHVLTRSQPSRSSASRRRTSRGTTRS